jgi:hypothetical protein
MMDVSRHCSVHYAVMSVMQRFARIMRKRNFFPT